jgi:hypothetical protein
VKRTLFAVTIAIGIAVAGGVVGSACTDSTPAAPAATTHVAEPSDVIDQDLMVALAQAKNFHHKAKVYMSDGNVVAATASVRQILSLKFPPNAPEADDVRLDARALLAKLLISQQKLDDAATVIAEGLAQTSRDSFFVANLYTVSGEVHEARAAQLDAATDDPANKAKATDERHAAIAAYDRSIQINETLQKHLTEGP